MSKYFGRTTYLVSLGIFLVGCILLFASLIGGQRVTNSLGGNYTTPTNTPLFFIGLVVMILAAIPLLIIWIRTLIQLAQLQKWGWFVFVLVLSMLALLVYFFSGLSIRQENRSGFTTSP